MADTLTQNYGWILPQDQASPDTWGQKLNSNFQAIDSQVFANTQFGNNIGVDRSATIPATLSFYNPAVAAGGQLRWQWEMDATAETGNVGGSNLNLLAYDNTGAAFSAPVLAFNRQGGLPGAIVSMTCNASVSFTQSLSVSSLTVTSSMTAGPTMSISSTAANVATLQFLNVAGSPQASISWAPQVGDLEGTVTISNPGSAPNASHLSLDNLGNFNFVGSGLAYKAGGGTWTAPSDARIKTVDGEYASGLEQVLALRPVVYRYKGNHSAFSHPYYPSYKQFVGLIAQEAEQIMPDLVTLHEGTIDGQEVTDLRALDPSNLIYALINAVKDLKAEIEALKAR
jgi:Chaperone of endosialidase